MRKKLLIVLILQGACLTLVMGVEARPTWTFELLGGDAYCFRMPLTITQSGDEDIELTATYKTNSFVPPIYYAYRFARWQDTRAWELEFVHLKMELTNPPSEVQHFEISHGYNLLTLNRAWTVKALILRVGGGIVISHPENTVRERSLAWDKGIFKTGYHLSGVTAQVAVGKRWQIGRKFFLTFDGKLTGSYARVPVADGHADVPNAAIHGLIGLGYEF